MDNNTNDRTHSGQLESSRETQGNSNLSRTEENRKDNKKDESIGKNMKAAERPRKSFHNDGPGGNYKGY
ncbi:hypothetical protein [Flavisolibacter ginsengisoli]|uniref:Uncharacterized protein n=1 Tax=Flavisolibacter ginsengisoli DSM 18119 TaxID=1121884 RepID=A0A1M4Y3X8_9BACT|nr:hypothetical protein [Flavisolibacter ginsengisoli]SHF00405.1 hypothetical protein SAMN02745131_01585 [Flavisolibacter ginsengisoli DSM 18119]